MQTDKDIMLLALKQAALARYQTYTNPMVGAAIVKNGQLLATGYHHRFGAFHAERDAISKLSPEALSGSTLFVTLEPCNHYGKQPPCSQLIIDSKIKKVIIAQEDPHQIVKGKGIKALKAAGIEVETGLLKEKAIELNSHYNYFYQSGLPFITLKQAVSLDNKVALSGKRTQITNQAVWQQVHRERANYQAIMIGSETALIDNPKLLASIASPYPPIRIIIDRRGRLLRHPELQLFHNRAAPTWIITEKQAESQLPPQIKVWQLQQADPKSVALFLAEKGIQSLYLEGGPTLASSFIKAGLVNQIITYIAPKYLGQKGKDSCLMVHPLQLHEVAITQFDNNVRISGKVRKCSQD